VPAANGVVAGVVLVLVAVLATVVDLTAVRELQPAAGTLLVVTHGDTARALCGTLQGPPPARWREVALLRNAGWFPRQRPRS
jgi:broad specificity phosphatase PhoE